jgi:hypothetical protein
LKGEWFKWRKLNTSSLEETGRVQSETALIFNAKGNWQRSFIRKPMWILAAVHRSNKDECFMWFVL